MVLDWYDGIKPVNLPAIAIKDRNRAVQYVTINNTEEIASLRPIPTSHWLIAIAMSE